MARSTKSIHLIDFEKVHARGEEGVLMARVAVAVNDFLSGNQVLMMVEKLRRDSPKADYAKGLGLYAIKLMVGHLYEAMLLIQHSYDKDSNKKQTCTIENTPGIQHYISILSQEAQDSYKLLQKLLKKDQYGQENQDPDREKFVQLVERFRNQVAFHYDTGYRGRKERESPIFKDAIEHRAVQKYYGRMILSEDLRETRLLFADDILDSAVCRAVFKIDQKIRGMDLSQESDVIFEWIQERARAFIVFGGELCERYFRSCAPS